MSSRHISRLILWRSSFWGSGIEAKWLPYRIILLAARHMFFIDLFCCMLGCCGYSPPQSAERKQLMITWIVLSSGSAVLVPSCWMVFCYRRWMGWMGWCAGRCCGWYFLVIGVSSGCATLCRSCFWWWIWGDAGSIFWGNKSFCKRQGASARLEGCGFFLFLDYIVHHTQISPWRDTIRILKVCHHMVGIGFISIEWLPWVLICGFSHRSVGFPKYGNS